MLDTIVSKREQQFLEIETFKNRFRELSLTQLRQKQALGYLSKPAGAAVRQLIDEKEASPELPLATREIFTSAQRTLCKRVGSVYIAAPSELKVGIALPTLAEVPLNGLRHMPAGDTTGWYLWGGRELSEDPHFFQPLHVAHVVQLCAAVLPYLGLSPGWRFLLAPDQEDVWFDPSLLQSE